MSRTLREHRHQANLERINQVQIVVGRGDRMRIDHEGTLLERARLMVEEIQSHRATERGLVALDHLLQLAEDRTSPQAGEVAGFIAAVRNQQPLALGTLRVLGHAAGDQVLAVLDAFRYGRLNMIEQVEGGPARVARVLDKWQAARA
jgi:hypothetical protein